MIGRYSNVGRIGKSEREDGPNVDCINVPQNSLFEELSTQRAQEKKGHSQATLSSAGVVNSTREQTTTRTS